MIWVIWSIFYFSWCSFSHLARKSRCQNITYFLLPKQRKQTKSFCWLLLKPIQYAYVMFYGNSFIFNEYKLKKQWINYSYLKRLRDKTFTPLIRLWVQWYVDLIWCVLLLYTLIVLWIDFFRQDNWTNDQGNCNWGFTQHAVIRCQELVYETSKIRLATTLL